METLPLVDPAAREAVASTPPLDLDAMSLREIRSAIVAMYPADDVTCEERFVPRADGLPDVRVLIYRPSQPQGDLPALLYLHGGGFVAGTPDMMGAASRKLAEDCGAVVVSVQYRLAPETPFPGPLEDCDAALAWIFSESKAMGIDPARVAVMGQSAGGGLAAALALRARDRGEHRLKAQFLVYPMLDYRTGTDAAPIDNPSTGECAWTRASNRYGWRAMRGPNHSVDAGDGHLSPALADDLSGLPPTFVAVGSLDLFLEEDVAYALRLSRAGVPVEAHVYPGGIHGFDSFPGRLADDYNRTFQDAIKRLL